MNKIKIVCRHCGKTNKTYDELNEILENCCSIDCKVKWQMKQEKDKIEKDYYNLPQEVKQRFLDLMHEGKSIGEAKDELNLSLDLACEIINKNIEAVHYLRSNAK